MRLKNKLNSAKAVIKLRLRGKRTPLAVRFNLTNRCSQKCDYCNIWNTKSKELSTVQVFQIIDALKRMGTVNISFSGGEPLLREDIGEILDFCHRKSISTSMNCNGFLMDKKVKKLKNTGLVKLSLDGNEEVHDKIRGKGSFKNVMKAIEALEQNKIKFSFATTLTKHNLNQIDFIFNIARKHNTFAAFQPIKILYMGLKNINKVKPDTKDFKEAIDKLIGYKKRYSKNIRNSLRGLYYTYNWPNYKKQECYAGKIFCMIMPNGDLLPCDRISYEEKIPNCVKDGFEAAFKNMPDVKCDGCGFCGSLEMNYLAELKLDVLGEVVKVIR